MPRTTLRRGDISELQSLRRVTVSRPGPGTPAIKRQRPRLAAGHGEEARHPGTATSCPQSPRPEEAEAGAAPPGAPERGRSYSTARPDTAEAAPCRSSSPLSACAMRACLPARLRPPSPVLVQAPLSRSTALRARAHWPVRPRPLQALGPL